jgi:REP element-mobilizing transposase RayT
MVVVLYNSGMARRARKESDAGVYHAMVRGINRQNIFEENADLTQFLDILFECRKISGYKLLGYCLMGNHAHLLVKTGNEPLSMAMKRIGVRYVSWYNRKYGRCGHLFQDRFKSEPIETGSHLLSVLRYIHQNPVKAGLCEKAAGYEWSSYASYTEGGVAGRNVDTEEVLGMFSAKSANRIDLFVAFTEADNKDIFLDVDNATPFSDRECREILKAICGAENAAQFQAMSVKERDRSIRLAKEKGLSIRQISRMTGISYGIVRSR